MCLSLPSLNLRFASRFGFLFFLLTLPASVACGKDSVLDLNGKPTLLFQRASGQAAALLFVRRDCPVSARYAPSIQHLSAEYGKQVRFYLVFPDKTETPAAIRRYLREYHYKITALRDPDRVLASRAQVKVTPEAAVFNNKGILIYHGRIDNLYEGIAKSRPAATTHELEDALVAVIHGTPLATHETDAVGCYIADAP
jgi:thiol-disulfide isomerase/thioredoxin